MEHEASGAVQKRRRKRCVCVCVAVVLAVVVVALALGLSLRKKEERGFMSTFIERCEKFEGYDCQNMWKAFAGAYVGRDPCNVSVEAYDPLIAAAPFRHACNQMMFWSKTKTLAHDFSDCFVTLEDTVLGSTLDNMAWCGKELSSDSNDTGAGELAAGMTRVERKFADAACGNVTAMLSGSVSTPFSSLSVFGSVELKRFKSTKVTNLNVVLVTSNNAVANCTNASLKELQEELDAGITYSCKEAAESQIQECRADLHKACGPCW